MKQRLHKILAKSTELSLRKAEEAIAAGEVAVNGHVVTGAGSAADPLVDRITWKGKELKSDGRKIYIAYHKPHAMLVTKSDPEGRKTIWDSDLRKFKNTLNAAGRLDYDSEGLLIVTNDGDLINKLTHPKHELEKTYNIKVRGFPSEESLNKLRSGMTVDDITYLPAFIKVRSKTEKHTWLEIRIREGKNRQIRRMLEDVGHPVLKLKREVIGPVRLGKLEASDWRFLKPVEIDILFGRKPLASLHRRPAGGRPHRNSGRRRVDFRK